MRARSAAPASMAALTGGAVTFTGSAVAPGVRTTWPSVRTTSAAEASRSSRLPPRPGTTWIRRPRRTSAALFGLRFTSAAILSRAYSSAAFDTARRGSTSAPNTRARMRRKPRSGPKPSPARLAAATAPPQSGWTPSWFAANVWDVVPATNSTGSPERFSKSDSSLATASPRVRPPTSTPATSVPGASSLLEPAKARPTRTASAATATRRPTTMAVLGRARRRARLRGAYRGDSARIEARILEANRTLPVVTFL